jgi:hypothetical protein
MGLHIENERNFPFAFLDSLEFARFNVKHVKEFSEHLVHGQKGQSHSTGGFEKIPTVYSETAAQSFAAVVDQPLYLVLFDGLWRREKFFAGDDPGGNR